MLRHKVRPDMSTQTCSAMRTARSWSSLSCTFTCQTSATVSGLKPAEGGMSGIAEEVWTSSGLLYLLALHTSHDLEHRCTWAALLSLGQVFCDRCSQSLPALPWEEPSFACAHTPLAHTLPDTSFAHDCAKDYISQIRSTPPGHLVYCQALCSLAHFDCTPMQGSQPSQVIEVAFRMQHLYSNIWHYL